MLHGEIKINGRSLGRWRAVRKSDPDLNGMADYQVTYNRDDQEWTDLIRHNPDEGAERLALTVMAFATVKMRHYHTMKKNRMVNYIDRIIIRPPES